MNGEGLRGAALCSHMTVWKAERGKGAGRRLAGRGGGSVFGGRATE